MKKILLYILLLMVVNTFAEVNLQYKWVKESAFTPSGTNQPNTANNPYIYDANTANIYDANNNYIYATTVWTPSNLGSNLTHWFKTDGGAGTDYTLNGSNVATWTNHGTAANFTNSTPASQPPLITNAINGQSAVEIYSGHTLTTSPNYYFSNDYNSGATYFWAVSTVNGVAEMFYGNSTQQMLISGGTGMLINPETAGMPTFNIEYVSGTSGLAMFQEMGTGLSCTISGNLPTTAVVIMTFNGSNSYTLWVNGSSIGLCSTSVTSCSTCMFNTLMTGYHCEIGRITGTLNSSDLTNLQTYLKNKYQTW